MAITPEVELSMRFCGRILFMLGLLLAVFTPAHAQEQSQPVSVSPAVRLARAKTAFVRNGGGSDVPFNVISMSFADWDRFVVADGPDNADIVVTVVSPDDGKKKDEQGHSGFGLTSQGKQVAGQRSEPAPPVSTRSDVMMAVYDAKTKVLLWSATEQPKGVQKGMSRDEKLVAAAERLMTRFREKLSPTPAP